MSNSKLILGAITVLLLSGCYYDIEEDLYPPPANCDTLNTTYSGTIIGLLQANGCLSCHSGSAPSGNISLVDYTSVRTVALNGKLYGAVTHAAGFSPMPQGGNKISTCQAEKIRTWIAAGAPNN